MKPGVYEMTMEKYQADPCPTPSLSSGTAHRLITQSPLHAWFNHPRLNSDYRAEEANGFDLGACAHALLLEGGANIVEIHFDDWRKKAAQEQRDEARAMGKIPVLSHKLQDARAMAEVARAAILTLRDPIVPFDLGLVERVLLWQEDEGVWCRARPDWMSPDRRIVLDYKTTAGCAEPNAWIRNQMVPLGYDVQAVHYLRGNLMTVGFVKAQWLFLVQENYRPFACSFVSLSPAMLDIAERKLYEALQLWTRCLRENVWKGYQRSVYYAEPTAWQADQDADRRITFEERLELATV